MTMDGLDQPLDRRKMTPLQRVRLWLIVNRLSKRYEGQSKMAEKIVVVLVRVYKKQVGVETVRRLLKEKVIRLG